MPTDPTSQIAIHGHTLSQATDERVSIGSNHYRRVHADAAVGASAWVRTDATGNALPGTQEVTIAYRGYTGDPTRIPAIASGQTPPVNDGERAIVAIASGSAHPQAAGVRGFTDAVKAQMGTNPVNYHHYGETTGAGLSMLSRAQLGGDAVCTEPFRGAAQVPVLARQCGVTEDALRQNTTSIFSSADSARDMGPGVGTRQMTPAAPPPAPAGAGAAPAAGAAGDDDAPGEGRERRRPQTMGEMIREMIGGMAGGNPLISIFLMLLSPRGEERRESASSTPPPPGPGDTLAPPTTPVVARTHAPQGTQPPGAGTGMGGRC